MLYIKISTHYISITQYKISNIFQDLGCYQLSVYIKDTKAINYDLQYILATYWLILLYYKAYSLPNISHDPGLLLFSLLYTILYIN